MPISDPAFRGLGTAPAITAAGMAPPLAAIRMFAAPSIVAAPVAASVSDQAPLSAAAPIQSENPAVADPAQAASLPPAALWNGGIPDSQARRLLNKAHWETTKFFLTARVRLLREMIERQEMESAGGVRAVANLEGLWLDWRTKGYSGRVETGGFGLADRAAIRREALSVFEARYPKDEAARAAFRRYLDRVDAYVPLFRPSNYRKRAFAALVGLATSPPQELAARIGAMLSAEEVAETDRYRAGPQEAVLASFEAAALASLRETNEGQPAGKKIVAVILLGSYAVRQSTPKSDLDYQLLTQDGGFTAVKPFAEALDRNWTENRPEKIEAIRFSLPSSRFVLAESFKNGYRVISPDAAAVTALSKDSFAPVPPTSWSRLRGQVFSAAYRAWCWSYLRLAPLVDALRPPSPIPINLREVYQELPGRRVRRLTADPALAALRAARVHLWTVRHGESESNRAGLLAGSETNAPLTKELNAKGLSGELQARGAAEKMYEGLGGDRWAREVLSGAAKPVVILFSPLRRAEQTANALKALLDEKQKELGSDGPRLYEARFVPDLKEMGYGTLDGTALVEAKKLLWWSNWDGITGAGRDFLGRFPGGESRFDVLLRQRNVLFWIAKRFPGRTVVTFAHFETVTAQRAILGHLTADANDGALRVTPVENAQPIELFRP